MILKKKMKNQFAIFRLRKKKLFKPLILVKIGILNLIDVILFYFFITIENQYDSN